MASYEYFHVDISDAMRELRRLHDGPDQATQLALAGVITAQYQATQEYVHIITGSLRASGKPPTPSTRRGVWHAEISYGGEAPGAIHNPVRYAQIEQSRAPGGGGYFHHRGFIPGEDIRGRVSVGHDFMAPVSHFEPQYLETILAYLRGAL